ncbi:hypothetical protein OS493_006249 [Desmophyllum pertusum]|uniref:2-phosphoxylose phosphatase 1 n=1 Tax=Desmophyllum pertusum TaxID=174260 RepID=A0A9X0A536_9CNID|nr:hypothetical protein OS493_006249 [Desmophyllum pertusum]
MIPLTFIKLKRRYYFMKYKFQRLNHIWKFIILALLGVLLWICVWNSSSESVVHVSYDKETSLEVHKTVQQNVENYCNFPMRTSGAEGSLNLDKLLNQQRFQLEMTQVLIRHGDRTPAVFIANMDNGNYDYDCTFKTADYNHQQMFEEYAQATRHFTLREFAKVAKTIHHLLPSGQKCQIGQLTQKGFLQHFSLGKHMRTAYSGLINTGIKSSDLLVRSTQRRRCVQSAAAFLYGLLTKDTIMSEGVTINITSEIWFKEDDDGVSYHCPSLRRRWDQYKQRRDYVAGAAKIEPIMQQFSRLLRTPRASLPTIIFLTDAIYTRHCYKYTLPCGPGGCVSEEMAAKAMEFGTWAITENCTGIADVATHPMLIQIAKRMINKSQRKSTLKFVLLSGHDTTVTPLLLNLGVHDRKRWTPYATRVAFELWRDTAVDSSQQPDAIDNFYFRVLVNGKVVTSKMKFCGDALVKGELCPVQELVSWLSDGTGVEGMDKKYKTLCSFS